MATKRTAVSTGDNNLNVNGVFFSFPEGWRFHAFDTWPEFQKAAGSIGLKGCDIVALDGRELWLIEVKDYTYEDAAPPSDLWKTVGLKCVGTLALLAGLARSAVDHERAEFARACMKSASIHVALHVELKDGGRKRRQIEPLLMPLKDKLTPIQKSLCLNKAHVTSTLAPSSTTPWQTRRDPKTRDRHADR